MNLPVTFRRVLLGACLVQGAGLTSLASSPSPSPEAGASLPTPAGHPLRGIVVQVLPEKSALLVQHEEIPGVMKAMTMLLKVENGVSATVAPGQPITGTLLRRADGWWLLDVLPVSPAEPQA